MTPGAGGRSSDSIPILRSFRTRLSTVAGAVCTAGNGRHDRCSRTDGFGRRLSFSQLLEFLFLGFRQVGIFIPLLLELLFVRRQLARSFVIFACRTPFFRREFVPGLHLNLNAALFFRRHFRKSGWQCLTTFFMAVVFHRVPVITERGENDFAERKVRSIWAAVVWP